MSATIKKIGIISSGSEMGSINPVLAAAIRWANAYNIQLLGFQGGFRGLIEANYIPLNGAGHLLCPGGSLLGAGRSSEFYTRNGVEAACKACKELELSHLIILGGDGSVRGAAALIQEDIQCVVIPCSLYNDVPESDYTIGFDTAADVIVDFVDKIRRSQEFKEQFDLVEIDTGSTGHLTLTSGVSCGADIITLPEVPCRVSSIVERMVQLRDQGQRSGVILVSRSTVFKDYVDRTAVEHLAQRMEDMSFIQTRSCSLGSALFGGEPSAFDRKMAAIMMNSALQMLHAGKSGVVFSPEGLEKSRQTKPLDAELLRIARTVFTVAE